MVDREEPNVEAAAANEIDRKPYRVRLPGFISDEDVGLGEVIKRATSTVGIRPCNSCAERAVRLNRWIAFTGRSVR